METRLLHKDIGFRRNIFLPWLDAVATLRLEGDNPKEIRQRLDEVLSADVEGSESRRLTIDILMNVWVKSQATFPAFHAAALTLFAASVVPTDRVWLHYGMALLVYPFFRQGVAVIGQLSRIQDDIAANEVIGRMAADLGHFGDLPRATQRLMFSLREWGVLMEGKARSHYTPRRRAFAASSKELEEWLLAVTLWAQAAEERTFPDLMRLPELFPFAFAITVDELRLSRWFHVQRQGSGWDMVRVAG